MPTLAVVDDRPELRQTLVRNIKLALTDDKWTVLDISPLPKIVDYPSWIMEHEVAALLLDERLDEYTPGHVAAGYRGHQLVEFLRQRMPAMPMYFVSTFVGDENIEDALAQVDGVYARSEMNDKADKCIPRILRAGQKYWTEYQEELTTLSAISKRIADGVQTNEDMATIEAIRQHLALAFPISDMATLSTWLGKATQHLTELEDLKVRIERKLKATSKKSK
jgi:hypothetical protein